MTPAEIQTNGTHTFSAPPEKVFQAAQSALKAEGYEIVTANEEKGLIKTNRKFVRADAVGNASSASAVEVTRQYILTITPDQKGGTKVEATPKVFQGEADLSEKSVWVIEGEVGERALWKRLFKEIDDNL
jgi:hypothetical protein